MFISYLSLLNTIGPLIFNRGTVWFSSWQFFYNTIFNNFIHDTFKNHFQIDVIYLDFAKAFDNVSHHILINVFCSFDLENLCYPVLNLF